MSFTCDAQVSPDIMTVQPPLNVAVTNKKILPFSWTDADNGYNVVRLTNEPNSKALDSRHNAFTPDGKDMVYRTPYTVNILNLDTRKSKIVISGPVQSFAVGTKTRRIFFTRGTDSYLYAVDIDTKGLSKVGVLPVHAEIMSVNADETLIVGKNTETGEGLYITFVHQATQDLIKEKKIDPNIQVTDDAIKERAMKMRSAAKTPENLFTVNLSNGQVKTILKTNDWLGPAEFSPTDPSMLLYAVEGMYYETDRIWLIKSDGSHNQLVHRRSQKDESATREFWSQDGKTVWYEWQFPRGKNFALVGYDVVTAKRKIFKMSKNEASISYNVSSGEQFFCGSGHHAASAKDGSNRGGKQSIELLYPVKLTLKMQDDPQLSSLFNFNDEMAGVLPDSQYIGWFRRVTLVNMFKNDYTKIEPNIRFTPDSKRVIFTSNMLGPTYVFAVDLDPADGK